MAGRDRYIIDFNKCLGKGATASVFLGIKIEDATQYAMKCSKYQLKKEISILKDLNHSNIVKYYDSLMKFKGYEQVIIMEYCNKGSLYDFIEMHQGLCDNMLLKMLECLNYGISYLRSKVLVHRDIKPGNMMVHEDCMGYFHIKLGDMGTAKRVEDDQTFPSLVGTEEYLHPDMYIRYLEGLQMQHKANVDLWSIGVTLYHAVVSKLPFLPHNYSRASDRAKEALKYMYESKKSGIISGRQNSEKLNDITWSSMLPEKCRLSRMLREKVSKLIGGLMDRDDSNTYNRFFEESQTILNLKRVLMFNSLTGELQLMYLENITYGNLVEQTSHLINVPRDEFILLTKTKRLDSLSSVHGDCLQSMPIRGHLKYELTDETVMAMITKLIDQPDPELKTRELTANCESPHPRYKHLTDAIKYSENLMCSIYQVNHATDYIDCQIDCYKAIVSSFNEHAMINQLCLMNEALPWQMKAIRDTCMMTESLVKIAEAAISNSEAESCNQDSLAKCNSEIDQLRQKALEGEKCGEQYYCKIVERREMIKFTMKNFMIDEGLRDRSVEDSLNHLVHLSEELVNEVKLIPDDKINSDDNYKLEIWQRHVRQFNYYQTAKSAYVGKLRRLKMNHHAFYIWMKQAINIMNRVIALRDFLKRQEGRRGDLRTKFVQVNEFVDKILSTLNLADKVKDLPALSVSGSDPIKSGIMEMKELTEKIKKVLYKDK